MDNNFKICGNYYLYNEKLEGDRRLGIQKNDDSYTIFVADKTDNVEELVSLRNGKDLYKFFDAIESFTNLLME